jgi:hypothetical protein
MQDASSAVVPRGAKGTMNGPRGTKGNQIASCAYDSVVLKVASKGCIVCRKCNSSSGHHLIVNMLYHCQFVYNGADIRNL